jgi:hypothetical protein
MEGEALPVQAGSHHCEQKGGRSDERDDTDLGCVSPPHEFRSRIGYGGTACLRYEPAIGALLERCHEPGQRRIRSMLVQRLDGEAL